MQLDTNNTIVKLCAEGMQREGAGENEAALQLFTTAWDVAASDFEKFIAAHYVARHQKTINDKLQWDQCSLNYALKITGENIKTHLPSLYLNIAKCYEDLQDKDAARLHYELALSFANFLPADGYGKMIHGGIIDGLKRVGV